MYQKSWYLDILLDNFHWWRKVRTDTPRQTNKVTLEVGPPPKKTRLHIVGVYFRKIRFTIFVTHHTMSNFHANKHPNLHIAQWHGISVISIIIRCQKYHWAPETKFWTMTWHFLPFQKSMCQAVSLTSVKAVQFK